MAQGIKKTKLQKAKDNFIITTKKINDRKIKTPKKNKKGTSSRVSGTSSSSALQRLGNIPSMMRFGRGLNKYK
tara:strand:- start:649 stop:867 length:219 start_codon:yes stop_codon:yes gene_type:complete